MHKCTQVKDVYKIKQHQKLINNIVTDLIGKFQSLKEEKKRLALLKAVTKAL